MAELYNMDVFRREEENDSESSFIDSEIDDSSLYFNPEKGNVVFASAYDNWGFRYVLLFLEFGIDNMLWTRPCV